MGELLTIDAPVPPNSLRKTASLPSTQPLQTTYLADISRGRAAFEEGNSAFVKLMQDSFSTDPAIIGWGFRPDDIFSVEVACKGLPLKDLPAGVSMQPWKERTTDRTILVLSYKNASGSAAIARHSVLTPDEIFGFSNTFATYLAAGFTEPDSSLDISSYQHLLTSADEGMHVDDILRKWSAIRHVMKNQATNLNLNKDLAAKAPVFLLPRMASKLLYEIERHSLTLRLAKATLSGQSLPLEESMDFLQFSVAPDRTKIFLARELETKTEDTEMILHLLELISNSFENGGARETQIFGGNIELVEGIRFYTVADNGIGIPPAMIETVFNEGISTRRNGTGLGLAYLENYIRDERQGMITVRSFGIANGQPYGYRHMRRSSGIITENVPVEEAKNQWQDRASGTEISIYLPEHGQKF